jgi:hypothetical protein
VIISWGWRSATAAYRQDYIDAATFSIWVYGLPVDISSASQTLTTETDGEVVMWRLPSRTFPQGTHQVVFTVTLDREITDGFGENYGPGTKTFLSCEIIVE